MDQREICLFWLVCLVGWGFFCLFVVVVFVCCCFWGRRGAENQEGKGMNRARSTRQGTQQQRPVPPPVTLTRDASKLQGI